MPKGKLPWSEINGINFLFLSSEGTTTLMGQPDADVRQESSEVTYVIQMSPQEDVVP